MFNADRCDQCGRSRREFGLGGCFCRKVPQPPRPMRASEWRALRAKRAEAVAPGPQLPARDLDTGVQREVDAVVAGFFDLLQDGADPWQGAPTILLKESRDAVLLDAVAEVLRAYEYAPQIEPVTAVGPGGRGAMQATWTDPTRRALVVRNPGA